MFGVDKGDQIRVHGGGFANKAHFKKWYKKIYLGILDCYLLNAYIAWNMAAAIPRSTKHNLHRHEFFTVVAEQMMLYFRNEDDDDVGIGTNTVLDGHFRAAQEQQNTSHYPVAKEAGRRNVRCAVCKLERNMNKAIGEKGMAQNVVMCSDCPIPAHNHVVRDDAHRIIHKRSEFKNMTCFQIVHSEAGQRLWKICKGGSDRVQYKPQQIDPIYQDLLQHHTGERTRKRRKHNNDGNNDEDEDEEEDTQEEEDDRVRASANNSTGV
ncbi:unknown protein [Seminavis robusta]|uniref:PiggyBac transposable element-derived protein domain-containing protein n=1 Tax=Seminavis robusta TaxID=568900 RepID=A0A9N8D9U9_9STRA|nr:unknown protein [Seminavis robusta]|eukprot:Sro6_g005660.1 n/a (265) ;mRNA; f:270106-270900